MFFDWKKNYYLVNYFTCTKTTYLHFLIDLNYHLPFDVVANEWLDVINQVAVVDAVVVVPNLFK